MHTGASLSEPMSNTWVLIAFAFWASMAIAQESPTDKPASAETASAVAETKEFKPPPEFITKKRGKHVLYCKRDSTIGTRFKTERCYSENQVREYVFAQQENKRDIDRVRSTCNAGGDPCVFQ